LKVVRGVTFGTEGRELCHIIPTNEAGVRYDRGVDSACGCQHDEKQLNIGENSIIPIVSVPDSFLVRLRPNSG